jgi:predicted dehydrogenase
MTPATLRIGIAGVAHVHAAGYIHESQRAANATLVGLWDADASRAQRVASQHGTACHQCC